jgi:dihydropteroate synthase
VGADLVNDVSGFRFDPEMAPLLAARRVPAVLMHLRGDFASMHERPHYDDVIGEVAAELRDSLARAERAGVLKQQLIVDPGIGFSKDAAHSLTLLRRLDELGPLDRPVLVGPSRKRFIGAVLGRDSDGRVFGTAAAVATAVLKGVHIVRVHDVAQMKDVVRMADAIREAA